MLLYWLCVSRRRFPFAGCVPIAAARATTMTQNCPDSSVFISRTPCNSGCPRRKAVTSRRRDARSAEIQTFADLAAQQVLPARASPIEVSARSSTSSGFSTTPAPAAGRVVDLRRVPQAQTLQPCSGRESRSPFAVTCVRPRSSDVKLGHARQLRQPEIGNLHSAEVERPELLQIRNRLPNPDRSARRSRARSSASEPRSD